MHINVKLLLNAWKPRQCGCVVVMWDISTSGNGGFVANRRAALTREHVGRVGRQPGSIGYEFVMW